MPRKKVSTHTDFPYHITARCHNQEWFDLPMPVVWSIMEDYLYLIHHHYQCQLHCFVLMSNHFHLLATAPNNNLSEAMRYFMRETSREITRLSGRKNQTYGQRFGRSMITSWGYFENVYRYVYQNPLRANLCFSVQEYPYSTLHGLLGFKNLYIPVTNDPFLFNPGLDEKILNWLNVKPSEDLDLLIRSGLRRGIFRPPLKSKTGEKIDQRIFECQFKEDRTRVF